jgi:F0F1-type ATP synthase membrane subunit b/b'
MRHNRKPAAVYARELISRYGKRAAQIASNRYDAAETESTAAYYEHVLTEIENARREAARLNNQPK